MAGPEIIQANLHEEVALVTGASRGIGRAIALALGEKGAAVALTARNKAQLEDVAREIEKRGGKALALEADLSREEQVAAIIPAVVEHFGQLTILVNNAGLGIYGPLEEASLEDWDRIMAVNARAPFQLCRDAMKPLRKAGRGFIFNVASVVGVKGYVNQALYTASKHAMMGFSKVLAQEAQEGGIRLHTLCPGGVDTDMVRQARPDLDPEILMQPGEIAALVLFLIAFDGKAVVDDLHIRRASGAPWF